MEQKIGLIVEGGGMRGAFSTGVLNALLDAGIRFPYLIGMSSGAACGMFYLSEQQDLGRSFFLDIARAGEEAFGLRPWLSGKGLFNMDFIISQLGSSGAIAYERALANPAIFHIGTTHAKRAEMVFWEKSQGGNVKGLQNILRASASLPVLSPPVVIQGEKYVDGGIIESIPLDRAFDDGCDKVVIIHTQPRNYTKKKQRLELISRTWLRPYPKLKKAIESRHIRYNKTLEKMYQLEGKGQVFVIEPEQVGVSRYGLDEQGLENYYHQGYALLWEKHEDLEKFLRVR